MHVDDKPPQPQVCYQAWIITKNLNKCIQRGNILEYSCSMDVEVEQEVFSFSLLLRVCSCSSVAVVPVYQLSVNILVAELT